MTRETVIDLIRHGEPEGGRMIRGQGVDHPLSAVDWAQLWAAIGEALARLTGTRVVRPPRAPRPFGSRPGPARPAPWSPLVRSTKFHLQLN